MRRCLTLLGLATSLAALVAVAIGPAAAASAGTPPAQPRTAAPHVAVAQRQRNCGPWTGIPNRWNNIEARACIRVTGAAHPTTYGWVEVRNRAHFAQPVSVEVHIYSGKGRHGGRYTLVTFNDNWIIEAGKTQEFAGPAPLGLQDPRWTRATVHAPRGGKRIYSDELDDD
jgi:hypothetical protein